MVMLEGTSNNQLLYCHKYVYDNICISTTKRSPTNQPNYQPTSLIIYIYLQQITIKANHKERNKCTSLEYSCRDLHVPQCHAAARVTPTCNFHERNIRQILYCRPTISYTACQTAKQFLIRTVLQLGTRRPIKYRV
jgi:hypothetical protein